MQALGRGSSCQSVGRSSRRPPPPPRSTGRRGGARPRIPRWGRSGDGGSGITEPERERPRGPVPGGGHGRPSPARSLDASTCPPLRVGAPPPSSPGSRPRRWRAGGRTPRELPGRRVPRGDAPSPWPRPPLPFALHALQILGSQLGPRPGVPRPPFLSPPLPLLSFRTPSFQVFAAHPPAPLNLRYLHRGAPSCPLIPFGASFPLRCSSVFFPRLLFPGSSNFDFATASPASPSSPSLSSSPSPELHLFAGRHGLSRPHTPTAALHPAAWLPPRPGAFLRISGVQQSNTRHFRSQGPPHITLPTLQQSCGVGRKSKLHRGGGTFLVFRNSGLGWEEDVYRSVHTRTHAACGPSGLGKA